MITRSASIEVLKVQIMTAKIVTSVASFSRHKRFVSRYILGFCLCEGFDRLNHVTSHNDRYPKSSSLGHEWKKVWKKEISQEKKKEN